MRRDVLYARYSPRPKDTDSIQAQTTDLLEYCRAHDLTPYCVCFDPDTSGTIPMFSRPGLAQALKLLRRGDNLVVRNLNRAARSISVGLAIEEELDRIGATLHSVENGGRQPSKRNDVNAWFLRCIQFLVADVQRIEGNSRTSRRMKQHQQNGRAMGKVPPYGSRLSDDHKDLEPDPLEQDAITQIVHLAALNYPPDRIASLLNASSDMRQLCRGPKWHPNTVRRILGRLHGNSGSARPR